MPYGHLNGFRTRPQAVYCRLGFRSTEQASSVSWPLPLDSGSEYHLSEQKMSLPKRTGMRAGSSLDDLSLSTTAGGHQSGVEARAYRDHPLLGSRLVLSTRTVVESGGRSLHDIFGSPDDLKFRSSMTLFATIAPDDGLPFRTALDRWCGGQMDQRTLALISQGALTAASCCSDA